jgi:hypothetical protein
MKLNRKDTEIRDQLHEMCAEGTADDEPMLIDVYSHLAEHGWQAHDIDIWFDNMQKVWRWVCTISKPQYTPPSIEGQQQLDIIHKGIEFSKTLNADNESYIAGAAYGYSCGYEAAKAPIEGTEGWEDPNEEIKRLQILCMSFANEIEQKRKEIESLKEQLLIASEQIPKDAFNFNPLNVK